MHYIIELDLNDLNFILNTKTYHFNLKNNQ